MKTMSINDLSYNQRMLEERFQINIKKIRVDKKALGNTLKTFSEPRSKNNKDLSTISPVKSNKDYLPLIDSFFPNNKKKNIFQLDETSKSNKILRVRKNNTAFLNNVDDKSKTISTIKTSDITCFFQLKNEFMNKTNRFTLKTLVPSSLSPTKTNNKSNISSTKSLSPQKTVRKNTSNFFIKKSTIINFDDDDKKRPKRDRNDVIKMNNEITTKIYYKINKKMSLSEVFFNEIRPSKSSKLDSLYYIVSNKNE